MIIKVCGMKNSQNIADLAKQPIDLIGLIFYPKSPRFVEDLKIGEFEEPGDKIKKVGVFVNSHFDFITQQVIAYKLDFVQLHGNESPEFCENINRILKLPVIKAFGIAKANDMAKINGYENINGYFLFDTKTEEHGGSGKKFDWSILNAYNGKIPFLLSGGISAEDSQSIRNIEHPQLAGIDINSRFENEAGLKDIELVKKFVKEIRK